MRAEWCGAWGKILRQEGRGQSLKEGCLWSRSECSQAGGSLRRLLLHPESWGKNSRLRPAIKETGLVLIVNIGFQWYFLLLLFNYSVMPDSLRPHGLSTLGTLSFTISRSLLRLTSIKLMMPSNHLILCHPLLLLLSVFPSIKVFPAGRTDFHFSVDMDLGSLPQTVNSGCWPGALKLPLLPISNHVVSRHEAVNGCEGNTSSY